MDDKIQDRTRSVPGIYAQLTLVSPTLTIKDSQQFWFIQLRKTAPEVFDNFCRRTSGTVARWPAQACRSALIHRRSGALGTVAADQLRVLDMIDDRNDNEKEHNAEFNKQQFE